MQTMDSHTENNKFICRLCLQPSDDVVNIWNTFEDSTIASILVKHFWFQIHKNDGLTESLCQMCWLETKTFHQFYKKVEQFQENFSGSANYDKKDNSGKGVNIEIGRTNEALEHDLNEIKCEETELTSAVINTQISEEESSDDDNISGEDESEKTLEKEDLNNEQQKNDDGMPDVTRNGWLSPSEKIELDGQIRELFNMKCEICSDVEFETLLKAKQHYRKVHDTQGYITCCGKKFALRCEIVNHMRQHINPNALQLDHQVRELFNMKCEICSDVEFETLLFARRHYRTVHEKRGYIKCSYRDCSERKFVKRFEIQDHIRYHSDPDAYQCTQCNIKCKNNITLKRHMDNHAPLDSREFKCSLCPSSFVKSYLLKHHVQLKHTSKTGDKFPCDKCGKNFRSSHLLKCHIRQVHQTTFEHMCEVCARRFKNKTALQYHIAHEHSTTPPPKVQCDICGIWLKDLRGHLALHKEEKETLHPVKCPICNKEIRTKRLLDKHISYTHGESRYPCNLCDKSFKQAKNLKEHIATHTGQDLYSCAYCEKKFKSNANMYKHRKVVHLAEWTRDCQQRNTSSNVSAERNA